MKNFIKVQIRRKINAVSTRNYFRATIFIFFICIANSLFAQSPTAPPKDSRFYEMLAVKEYEAKNFAGFLENMKHAERLRPNHPRLLYHLADAYALNGKTGEAIATLEKLAAMRLVYAPEKDADFDSLKTDERFQNIVRKFAANALPVGSARTILTVPEKGLVAESVAFDAATKTFYVASVAQRKILSVNERGEAKIFADQNAGILSAMGMKIDAPRRILWVATAAHSETPNLKTEEKGTSGILKFDLQTGKLVKKYLLPNQPKAHNLGDLTIAANGDVYATDSVNPTIYVVRKDAETIEPFLESEQISSLQGLDFSPDNKFLFVADYGKGILRIDTKTKEIKLITPSENSTLLGIDGLYFYKNNLIATQNGVAPQRIVRLALSKNFDAVEHFDVLAANAPDFDEITLGAIKGNEFYFVANSQWNLLGENGKISAPEKLKNLVIQKISLP